MPGWHDATAELQKAGKLKMVGILQEQHPARARLFMQWKQMDWPLMVDSLNLLGVEVVPITVLVDEHGIVRKASARPGDLADFLARTYEAPPSPLPVPERRALRDLQAATRNGGTDSERAEAWRAYGRSLVLWGEPEGLGSAIEAFSKALEAEAGHPSTHFELGVAYRSRYDLGQRRNTDFQHAVDHWSQALELDPNQYIWRRRIQQYGPRLDKPYPFYDWVEEARGEIRARGEEPVRLVVEPAGAELARPARSFETAEAETAEAEAAKTEAAKTLAEPDPKGRIRRDERGFVDVERVVVPAAIQPGKTGRIHLVFRPNRAIKAHWNNEAEDLALWIDPPDGWEVDRRFRTVVNPEELVSVETRRIELELRSPEDAKGRVRIPAYALYYVCEDTHGTCLYRRQDIDVDVKIDGSGP